MTKDRTRNQTLQGGEKLVSMKAPVGGSFTHIANTVNPNEALAVAQAPRFDGHASSHPLSRYHGCNEICCGSEKSLDDCKTALYDQSAIKMRSYSALLTTAPKTSNVRPRMKSRTNQKTIVTTPMHRLYWVDLKLYVSFALDKRIVSDLHFIPDQWHWGDFSIVCV